MLVTRQASAPTAEYHEQVLSIYRHRTQALGRLEDLRMQYELGIGLLDGMLSVLYDAIYLRVHYMITIKHKAAARSMLLRSPLPLCHRTLYFRCAVKLRLVDNRPVFSLRYPSSSS